MYVYVCLSVEVLPLVEFFIDEDIEDKEVLSLLELEPVRDKDKFKETKSGRKITLSHVIWHDSFVWTEKLIETKNKNIYKLATCESFFFHLNRIESAVWFVFESNLQIESAVYHASRNTA